MKKFILLTLVTILCLSCKGDDDSIIVNLQADKLNACYSDEPLKIPWIKDLVETMNCGEFVCKISLMASEYQGETVFYTTITDPVCNYQAQLKLYNCSGRLIKDMSNEESLDYLTYLYIRESQGEKNVRKEIFHCNSTEE